LKDTRYKKFWWKALQFSW